MVLIIDEVSFQDNKEQHEENISAIKKEIENLQEKEFLSCLDLLKNVVITNDIENTIKKHGYIEMSKGFYAATHKVGNKYDIIIRYEKAMEFLTAASEHGNLYATQLLHSIKNNRNWNATMGTTCLLHRLGRTLQNRLEEDRKGKAGGIDRKLKRQIDEKKQAQGLRQG